jgi:hypothetical protein
MCLMFPSGEKVVGLTVVCNLFFFIEISGIGSLPQKKKR